MLLFNNMKAKLFGEAAERFWQSILLIFGVLIMAALAAVAIGSAVLSNQLVAGPDFVIASPETDSTALGTVTVTPVELDDVSLRVSWGFASAAVLFGIGLFFLAALRLLAGESKRPIFGREASGLATVTAVCGALLILGGALARTWMSGSIGRAAGIPESSAMSDLDLWVFDVPSEAYLFLVFSIGWVWRRGAQLQEDVDQVV